jgi:hypothetical protein
MRVSTSPQTGDSHLGVPAAGNGIARPRNYILTQMPEAQYHYLSKFLIPQDMPLGLHLSQPHQEIENVYFPTSGLISTDALTESGDSVEVGVTGRGLPANGTFRHHAGVRCRLSYPLVDLPG